MSTALARYEAARRDLGKIRELLDSAKTLDDVKKARAWAVGIEDIARMARDKQLIADVTLIQVDAECLIGRELVKARESGALRSGPARKGIDGLKGSISLKSLKLPPELSSRAQRMAKLPAPQFKSIRKRLQNEILSGRTRVSFETVQREAKKEKLRDEHRERTYDGGTVKDLEALAASGFRAKVCGIDPQWLFETRGKHGDDRAASQHYDVEELSSIAAMIAKVLPCLDDDAVIAMWTVDWNMHAFFELVQRFDLTIVTKCFNWTKLTKTHDGTPRADGKISDADFHFGQGYYSRANSEDCWLLTRRKPQPVLRHDVRSLIVTPVMEHSRKPDQWLERLEQLFAGPYIEINARRPRKGWVSYGNELPFVMPGSEAPYDLETGEILDERFTVPSALPATIDPAPELEQLAREVIATEFPAADLDAIAAANDEQGERA